MGAALAVTDIAVTEIDREIEVAWHQMDAEEREANELAYGVWRVFSTGWKVVPLLQVGKSAVKGLVKYAGALRFRNQMNSFALTGRSFFTKISSLSFSPNINKLSQRLWRGANGAGDVVFGSARDFVRTKYGQNLLNHLIAKFGTANDGAAAVILQKWGDDGLAILNKSTVNTLDDAVNELLKNKTAYRHISSNVAYLEQLKVSGKVPQNANNTYFSLDKFDDPVVAIDKMQLNADATDAAWRLEFDATQLIGKSSFPKGRWNNAEYIEVLTRSYPNFGSGGASQFITQSEITLKRMINLKTGQVINF